MAPELIFPKEELAVTTPRQLAPTVGPMMKRVEIVAAKVLVAKAFRHGFFWLTAKEDAINIVKTCEGCQRYAKQAHLPAQ